MPINIPDVETSKVKYRDTRHARNVSYHDIASRIKKPLQRIATLQRIWSENKDSLLIVLKQNGWRSVSAAAWKEEDVSTSDILIGIKFRSCQV